MFILFQQDIRRALARVGRGFFPNVSAQQESQIVEEVIRAAQSLSQKRVGALIVLERETALDDQIAAGTRIDAQVSMELLVSIFLPSSPLHDGAAVIQDGRVSSVGCILPLTLRNDLPEGVGTRHRAAVGITEETDAVVIVVSEETATISVVMAGEMVHGLDAPRLRVVLRDVLSGERRELPASREISKPLEVAEAGENASSAS
jgi:diadenylate cyclase